MAGPEWLLTVTCSGCGDSLLRSNAEFFRVSWFSGGVVTLDGGATALEQRTAERVWCPPCYVARCAAFADEVRSAT